MSSGGAPTIDMSVTASSASASSASATDAATHQAAGGGWSSATVIDTLTSRVTILGTSFNTAAQARANASQTVAEEILG